MLKKTFFLIFIIVVLVVAAGIYRFNFTTDDIYVEQADGQVIPFGTNNNNNVMLALFSIRTDKYWQIQLPNSKAKANLTDLKEYDDIHLAIGKYQDGEENGLVSLDYRKITTLNLGDINDEMFFSAPFSVSNQGTGVFWYLGLFKLNTKAAEIKHIDTFFLGDRIKVNVLKQDEPFDVTSSLHVIYFEHSNKQSMVEIPSKAVEQRIKVSKEGFRGSSSML